VPTGHRVLRTLARSVALVPVLVVALQKAALAAEVVITPAASASPSKDFGGWTFKMAIASICLTALVILLMSAAYLRYAPGFFTKDEATGPPPLRPQARGGAAPAAVALDAPPLPRPAAASATAVAVAEAPPDAPPVEAATEVAAPAAAEAAPAPAAAAAPAAPRAAAAPAPPRPEGPLEQDQETYDRVLAEELAKGTDRRVAEGRAKSAAIRAARKKAASG